MGDAVRVKANALEHLRIARLLEAHGDAIGAILAYREVIREGGEPEAGEARSRVAALARRASPAGSSRG